MIIIEENTKLSEPWYNTFDMTDKQDEKAQKELGEKLRIARESAGLTQEQVVKGTGMKSNYYAKIERGEINTTFEKLYKIIKALKIEASDIFPS